MIKLAREIHIIYTLNILADFSMECKERNQQVKKKKRKETALKS